MSVIESGQWPPVKEHFYINLALITSDFIPRSDSYSRATIRGSVDDVYKKKDPIKYSEVFPDQLAQEKHYVSLIEGRPGCGKSTLITKVTKDWADKEILKDMELFILIRLRRFVDRRSLTLKDLLGIYCPSQDVLDKVYDKITEDGGKGVCFAFDGLDEYSSKLTPSNLVMRIIHGHDLPRAAVFMTSRPATSERFRRKTLLTKHIEIIGFQKKEIEAYINLYYKDSKANAFGLIKYITDNPNILPNTETDLYYKFTLNTLYRCLIKDVEEQSDLDDIELEEFCDLPGKKEGIFKQVCKLAFVATKKQKQMFTGKEVKKLANLPEIPLKRDFDSVGLLTVDRMISQTSSLPTKTFSFLHLTHQEFLAAVHIVDHLSDSDKLATIEELAGEVHMWEVWKFLCGLYARNTAEDSLAGSNVTTRSDTFSKLFQSIIARNVSTRLACLKMVHCAFESRSPDSCSDLLHLIQGVINVIDIALNPSDCSALGYVLAKACKDIKKIDFSYCHLGPDGIAAFVNQLKELKEGLTEVDMLR